MASYWAFPCNNEPGYCLIIPSDSLQKYLMEKMPHIKGEKIFEKAIIVSK
uniref:Uncharacterized protein n=1 Tax=Rhizophora mucronata TaxID=61149 RepID=A0A2P2IQL8_RHIMU